MTTYDVAIIGSGFAGTILARVLGQQGQRILLLEKGHHPRFALGESTTPLANFALERLARRSGLEDLFQLATYGRWMEHLPHLRRGLKRGFTFYRHRPEELFSNGRANEHRLLVAASPQDALADSHWLRQDVDHHLVRRALAEGIDVRQDTTVEAVERVAGHLRLHTSQNGREHTFRARYVVDGSGPAAVLSRGLGLSPVSPDRLPQARLVYAHVECPDPFARSVGPSVDLNPGPYPDEQAAVHHLLDNGWIYLLPFDPEIDTHRASIGAVLYESSESSETSRETPETLWQRTLKRYPTLEGQLSKLRPLHPWASLEQMAYRQSQAAGEGWFLLPHTFAFVDPMFSTGMAWSLLAVERLCDLLGSAKPQDPSVDSSEYSRLLQQEADQITRLIASARLAQDDFELFKHITFLYFATVSHAELRQRLVEPSSHAAAHHTAEHCWEGFLGATDPQLVHLFESTHQRLTDGLREGLASWLQQSLTPYDAIGLFAPGRNNLYPVDLDALVERAHILGLSRQQIEAALPRLRGEPSLNHFVRLSLDV